MAEQSGHRWMSEFPLFILAKRTSFFTPYTTPILTHGLLYTVFIFINASIAYFNRLNGRFLLPIYLPLVILVLLVIQHSHSRPIKQLSIFFVILFTVLQLQRTVTVMRQSVDGIIPYNAYNTRKWNENAALNYWKENLPQGNFILLSNYDAGVAFQTNHMAFASPRKTEIYGTEIIPLSIYEEGIFKPGMETYLIWIEPNTYKHVYEPLELAPIANIERLSLRILDTKNPGMQQVVANAPELMAYLGDESLKHFNVLTATLNDLGISYEINSRLVRGLDYYSKTVFEWVTDELCSQGTVCAGGRYDSLIEQLGGKPNFAVGFAMGIERLLALIETLGNVPVTRSVDVYMIRVGETAEREGLRLAETIRNEAPGLKLQVNCGGGSFKSQFKKADKSGAEYAIILGDDEVSRGEVSLKSLRSEQEQQTLSQQQTITFLQGLSRSD